MILVTVLAWDCEPTGRSAKADHKRKYDHPTFPENTLKQLHALIEC